MSKLDEDVVVATVIEPYGKTNGLYRLGALRCVDGSHVMPYLEFVGENTDTWDNEDYLLSMLLALRAWESKVISKEKAEFLKEIQDTIPEEHFEDLLLMLEKADKLGFFNEN